MENTRERGAVAVTAAITLLVLIGFATLALDGGVVYGERRATQNAADHAALAAAWAECKGEDPQAAAINSATANGYVATDVVVTPEGDGAYRARVTAIEDTNFGKVIDIEEVTVVSEAVAQCSVSRALGPYALFAGAEKSACSTGLDTPGSAITVNGQAHSNGDVASPGPPTGTKNYNDLVTYGPGGSVSGNMLQFKAGVSQVGVLDYPVPDYWTLDNYDLAASTAPGTPAYEAAQAGDYYYYPSGGNFGSSLPPGLHYVNGSAQFSGSSYAIGNVTIVATGNIHFSGSNIQLTSPYFDDGLLLFSNHPGSASCSSPAIQYSNARGTWQGVWFAPNGQIRINSATGITLNGSLIGYTINLAGANRNINYNQDYAGETKYAVTFTE